MVETVLENNCETVTNSSVVTSRDTKKPQNSDHYNPSVRELNIPKLPNGACGFDLSRSKWDPYPWVSGVDKDSTAETTGLKVGDCVLEVNGEDILGLRIIDVANLVKAKSENVTLLLWTTGMEPTCNPESLCCGPMPLNLDRLSASMQTILAALECPICLDTIPPPVIQCMNGHLICLKCRIRADKCPICRQRYTTGRSLIAEQVYTSITEAFKLREDDGKLRERLFGVKCRKSPITTNVDNAKSFQSHTHKFLAKIMGKSSSLDNLSSSNKKEVQNQPMSESKQLSLSVNEIFRHNSSAPTSRSTSPQRLTPEIGSQTHFGTRRPLSHNASIESLPGAADDLLQLIVPENREKKYQCPCGVVCEEKMTRKSMRHHIINTHHIPIIDFGTPSATIALPPRTPMENACLILVEDEICFYTKLELIEGDYFITTFAQTDEMECSKYYLEVKIGNSTANDSIQSKEIISRSIVLSLEKNSWKCALCDKNGVSISKECISATFDNTADIHLTASIKRI
ncbi:uncharacterized protein LOC119068928 [Bradysia coprophila]|uniref:uncharacterized protein LOC119068928 n=1 Tax=Bradysia coprophila TaxID=38358 RepID=UPI00187D8CD6|nr:uncharacterized protein LOC119068928 [Bradysia coprophila]